MADVCIIGAGRVGLPLALTLSRHHNVSIVERDTHVTDNVESGIMPFHEPGFNKDISKKIIKIQNLPADEANLQYDHLVVCIGTPLLANLEPDINPLFSLFQIICGQMQKGRHICLRSTVAPGVCEKLISLVQQQFPNWELGKDYYFSYCPERISEGLAFKELVELPQIIGTYENKSRLKAEELFVYADHLLTCDVEEAELCKVFCNAQRYAEFAIGNQLAMIAMKRGKNPHKIFELAQTNYPRFRHIKPGYTAGTCLRKDFGFLSWATSDTDIFTSAWKINEHLPIFMVNELKEASLIKPGTKVLLAGATFKKDCDDMRDSLGSKIIRQLKFNLCDVHVFEPMIDDEYIEDSETKVRYKNYTLREIKYNKYDIIVIGSPHDKVVEFVKNLNYECWISDIWGITKNTCKAPLYKNTL